MGTAAKYNRSYNGDHDVTLSTEVDTESSSTIYTLNAVQQHSFGNTSPSSTLFIAAFSNTTLRWILQHIQSNQKCSSSRFGSIPFKSWCSITQGRQHSSPRKCWHFITSPSTQFKVPGHPTHKTTDKTHAGSWLSDSQNLAIVKLRFLVTLFTKPRASTWTSSQQNRNLIAACKGNPTDASQRTPPDIRTIK